MGNKISCRLIQSVIILVINKSESRCAVVRFCYDSYDYKPYNIRGKITELWLVKTEGIFS